MKVLRYLAILLGLAMAAYVCLIITVAVYLKLSDNALPIVQVATQSYSTGAKQDPTLLTYAQSMHIEVLHIDLVYATFPDSDMEGKYTGQDGNPASYLIQIKPGMTENETRITLAHEYYHYIYYTHDTELYPLKPVLNEVYASDLYMQHRMQPYLMENLEPDVFTSELFSIYCTEDSKVDARILAECNKWVDRSMTVAPR